MNKYHSGKQRSLQFELDGFKCYARVSYTPPMGKWEADSDLDYYGGYDILDLSILNEYDEMVAQHESPITYDVLVREYELADCFDEDDGTGGENEWY